MHSGKLPLVTRDEHSSDRRPHAGILGLNPE